MTLIVHLYLIYLYIIYYLNKNELNFIIEYQKYDLFQ